MKDVLVRAGSSLLAAVIGYLVLTLLSDGLSASAKIACAVGLGVLAFVVSVWAAGSDKRKPQPDLEVASNLKGKSAAIEDVDVTASPGQTAKVASDIVVDGAIEIKGAKVRSDGGAK